ncbi:hypothetical protein MN2019_25830 [Mycolicibacterium neoaurum]|uniref:hypothetical protein n=1 Tax=Mycolicibacterium neoaurum TaxID=1795 RepID=UPI001BCF1EAC|nr:hypothetical protein [Mycolicibacterium neoaurum]QVI27563.1 hypothetical protein MN2019_25830 [Mycolicibacterium neoaurum]
MDDSVAESGSRRLAASDVKALRVFLRAGVNQTGTRKFMDPGTRARIELHFPLDGAVELVRVALDRLTQSRAISEEESLAWLNAAGMLTPIRAKSEVANALGLGSTRAVDGRLRKVDRVMAPELSRLSLSSPRESIFDPLGLLLRAVELDSEEDYDSADGYMLAAADLSAVKDYSRIKLRGADRSKRARVRRQALEFHRRGSLVAKSVIPVLPPTSVEPVWCTLADEPTAAVDELERVWRANIVVAYPLLIDHALRLVPDLSAAGIETRLKLLEVIANLYRDAEVLAAITWARLWGSEVARAYPGSNDIRLIKAKRTVAHGLQVHGYWPASIRMLKSCEFNLLRDYKDHPEFALELGDIRHRLLSSMLAAGEASDANTLARRLALNEDTPGPAGVVRDALHVRSIEVQVNRRHGARVYGSAYDAALSAAFDELAAASGARYFGLADAILHSSHRVGDWATITNLVEKHSIGAPAQWANLAHRIEHRIVALQAKVSTLPAPNELGLTTPLHPLRKGGRVAADLSSAI